MAVLGKFGKLELKRDAPTPFVFDIDEIDFARNFVQLSGPSFRTGDLVEVASTTNWPHTTLTASYYVANYDIPGSAFDRTTAYPSGLASLSPLPINQLFIHVDQLYRCSFYLTRAAALDGQLADRQAFVFANVSASDVFEIRLINEWHVQAQLQDWVLNLDAREVDTTGLGERFFDGVKSVISGGGTLSFIVDSTVDDTRNAIVTQTPSFSPSDYLPCIGSSNLLRLLLSINEQAEADAEFWMIQNRELSDHGQNGKLLPGELYYAAKVTITNTAVNTAATDIITGSAQFVTVRDIRLLEGRPLVAGTYWIAELAGASGDTLFYGVATDSAGNVYAVGSTTADGEGGVDFILAKYDFNGVIEFQITIGSTDTDTGYGIFIDSNDAVYVVGSSGYTIKLSKSGVTQWQRDLATTLHNAVAVDSTGNVYVGGYAANVPTIAKYSSAGVLQWQREQSFSGALQAQVYGADVDSGDDVYFAGRHYLSSGSQRRGHVFKYNSAGTVLWEKIIEDTTEPTKLEFYDVAINSQDRAIVVGTRLSNAITSYRGYVAEFSSTGTLNWQKEIINDPVEANDRIEIKGVAVDAIDNIYVTGMVTDYVLTGQEYGCYVAKFNAAGDLQWSNVFRVSPVTKRIMGKSIVIDAFGDICISGGDELNTDDAFVLRLTASGSLIGTHGTFTYEAYAVTVINSTDLAVTTSLTTTSQTTTYADSAGSLVAAPSTLTSTTTQIS